MKRTRKRSLIKMVDDSTIVVHDFKRRTSEEEALKDIEH